MKRIFHSIRSIAATAALLLLSPAVLSAAEINLNAQNLYIKQGFSAEWIKDIPSDGGWTILPGNPSGRMARIPDLNLPGMPVRSFLSTESYPVKTFTYITSFDMTGDQLRNPSPLGLFIGWIGMDWNIYINGSQLSNEHYLGGGTLTKNRTWLRLIMPLDMRMFKEGRNIIAYRITGDPTVPFTGIYKGPNRISDYTALERENNEIFKIILMAFYFSMGVYFLFHYFTRYEGKYFLFFGLFTIDICIYLFSRSHFVYFIVPDATVSHYIEYISLFLAIPLIGLMFDHFIRNKASLVSKIYMVQSTLFILLLLIFPINFSFDLLFLWQIGNVIPLLYYPYTLIRYGVIADYQIFHANVQSAGKGFIPLRSAWKTLTLSFSGNMLISITALCICVVFDILNAIYLKFDIILMQYGFFIFIMGVSLILANRFTMIHRQAEILNEELTESIQRIKESHYQLTLSEEKYRFLVEFSNDLVFNLSTDGFFLNASSSLLKEFRIQEKNLAAASFFDIIHRGSEERALSVDIAQAHFNELLNTRKTVTFKTKLSSSTLREPKDFNVQLEYVDINGRSQILGKAAHIYEDTLLSFFYSEQQHYAIDNYLIFSEQISQRIVRNAEKYISHGEAEVLQLALREIIINAVEHGNLNITFEEKTAALNEGRYFELLKERQIDPLYKNRNVTVEYSINADIISCTITDEGSGFDHTATLNSDPRNINDTMISHGRGILITRNIFDSVQFNEKGNSVTLIKNLSKS